MSQTYLTTAEIKKLTGKTYAAYQVIELRRLGIPCFRNSAGECVALRSEHDRVLGSSASKPAMPDFEAIDGATAKAS